MASPTIGIIGFGYLGKTLAQLGGWSTASWATGKEERDSVLSDSGFRLVAFDWRHKESWKNLPQDASALVLTIPPVCDEVAEEIKRIESWCEWMAENRSGLKKLIYISSTGVYPNQAGNWKEQDHFRPDSRKGELRFATEKKLGEWFRTISIRAGAIYGTGRNIGVRILQQKPIPGGKQPVHRIHVKDLARVVQMAIVKDDCPSVINAVDLESKTTDFVANWLVQQDFFPHEEEVTIRYSNQFQTRKFELSEPNRRISNQLLTKTCQFNFLFPTYREGLRDALRV